MVESGLLHADDTAMLAFMAIDGRCAWAGSPITALVNKKCLSICEGVSKSVARIKSGRGQRR